MEHSIISKNVRLSPDALQYVFSVRKTRLSVNHKVTLKRLKRSGSPTSVTTFVNNSHIRRFKDLRTLEGLLTGKRVITVNLCGYLLEIKPQINVRLKKKDVSIFVIKLLKPFRRIVIKHPLVDMNLRFYKKSILLTDREMVSQVIGIIYFKTISNFITVQIGIGLNLRQHFNRCKKPFPKHALVCDANSCFS